MAKKKPVITWKKNPNYRVKSAFVEYEFDCEILRVRDATGTYYFGHPLCTYHMTNTHDDCKPCIYMMLKDLLECLLSCDPNLDFIVPKNKSHAGFKDLYREKSLKILGKVQIIKVKVLWQH